MGKDVMGCLSPRGLACFAAAAAVWGRHLWGRDCVARGGSARAFPGGPTPV